MGGVARITAASSDDAILAVLHETADAIAEVLAANDDWSLSGLRATQYSVDVKVDAAALEVLGAAGVSVLSEESGVTGEFGDGAVQVVMDPLDGSTNCARRVPWYATALCARDARGPRAALVVNQASGTDRWWAARGAGAWKNGARIAPSRCATLGEAVVGVSGHPRGRGGWAQFRALGAAALDICLVAEGTLDAWVDFGQHGIWDYLASALICTEAGALVADVEGREVNAPHHDDRRVVVAAATAPLHESLLALRRTPVH